MHTFHAKTSQIAAITALGLSASGPTYASGPVFPEHHIAADDSMTYGQQANPYAQDENTNTLIETVPSGYYYNGWDGVDWGTSSWGNGWGGGGWGGRGGWDHRHHHDHHGHHHHHGDHHGHHGDHHHGGHHGHGGHHHHSHHHHHHGHHGHHGHGGHHGGHHR